MTVKEYMIVGGDSSESLVNYVNVRIREGWQPIGGVSVGGRWYTQAMVKYAAANDMPMVKEMP